jgi:hypothetical protein
VTESEDVEDRRESSMCSLLVVVSPTDNSTITERLTSFKGTVRGSVNCPSFRLASFKRLRE